MMTEEIKSILNSILRQAFLLGVISIIIMMTINEERLGFIYCIGLMTAIINFLISGAILNKSLHMRKIFMNIVLPFSYISRISIVIIIGLSFANELKFLSAYLVGFISYFPILMLSWFRKRRVSE